jgi:nicotinamidase-related amidase
MSERGWVSYLSSRDRDGLGSDGSKPSPFGLGRSPALLVVDVYREALGTRQDADDLERWPMSCGSPAWAAVDRIGVLIEAFRRRSLPVIHVTGADLYTRWGHRESNRELDLSIVPEVAPRRDEMVIGKAAPSAFQGTSLAFHLIAMEIDTLIVCGEATSGCVRATVVDAATHRYRVGVVEECCFDRVEASHWINLFDMEQKYADVMSSVDVVSYLDLVAAGATALEVEVTR